MTALCPRIRDLHHSDRRRACVCAPDEAVINQWLLDQTRTTMARTPRCAHAGRAAAPERGRPSDHGVVLDSVNVSVLL